MRFYALALVRLLLSSNALSLPLYGELLSGHLLSPLARCYGFLPLPSLARSWVSSPSVFSDTVSALGLPLSAIPSSAGAYGYSLSPHLPVPAANTLADAVRAHRVLDFSYTLA